ncbi:MAG: hypothetical protein GYB31_04905 [Bacteroidetes bacterium]|nr:hypothetical protein [Bacteroidota bacterium]
MNSFRLYVLLSMICLPLGLKAQYQDIQPSSVERLGGIPFIEASMKIAENAFDSQDYVEAAKRAQEAGVMARQIKHDDWQARALQLEAKAGLESGGRKLQTARLLRKSNDLTNDPDVKLENLELLRSIALDLRRTDELKEIAKEISEITGEPVNEFLDKRKTPKEALKDIAQERQALNDELANLEKEQIALQEAMLRQEKSIAKMNEEQAKTELLITQQKMLLDSLAFAKMADSLQLEQQQMLLSRQEMEIRERDARLRLQRSRMFLLISLVVLFILGVFALYNRNKNIKKHAEEMAAEQARSESLLLNILPAAVADELKTDGKASVRTYDTATVLFTDFKDFTQIAEGMPPQDLVADLDYCFRAFDEIIEKYGLEKIKTIGDSYMCAGGIPEEDSDHPVKVGKAALEMQAFLNQWKRERGSKGKGSFEARIGIHSGPLVAGVVGSKKFAYDIWGNTVNLASRMESSGEVGKVNISEETHRLIQNNFKCSFRGKIAAKNAGEVGMYFIE